MSDEQYKLMENKEEGDYMAVIDQNTDAYHDDE